MSKTVDERVVSMQFDNKNFESNVKTTMSTLDKLKQSLKLENSAKGLDNIKLYHLIALLIVYQSLSVDSQFLVSSECE